MGVPPDDPLGRRRTLGSKRARPTVVYALDQRPVPASALSRVVFFTRLYGAKLDILRVTSKTVGGRRSDVQPASVLSELVAAEPGPPVAAQVVERRGPARPTILDYARSRKATLLVVDAQLGALPGRSASGVVSRLGRSAPCPVMVMPRARRQQAWDGAPLREVLCAVDHGPATAATLQAALFIARRTRARLTLLHVLQGMPLPVMVSGMEAARVVQQCEALAAAEGERLKRLVPARTTRRLQLEYAVRSGAAERAIARVSAETGAQLIVLGVVPRNLVDVVLVGSTSGPVLRRAPVPVLLVPALTPPSQGNRRLPARRPAGLRMADMHRERRGGAR